MERKIKLLVTGGRDYRDITTVNTVLRIFHKRVPIGCLVHGDAMGADRLCRDWAIENGIPMKAYPVTTRDYERFGRGAPIIRNYKMVDNECPDLVVAFPGKNGTAQTIEYAVKNGVPVYDVKNDRVIKPIKWQWDFRNYLKHLNDRGTRHD